MVLFLFYQGWNLGDRGISMIGTELLCIVVEAEFEIPGSENTPD